MRHLQDPRRKSLAGRTNCAKALDRWCCMCIPDVYSQIASVSACQWQTAKVVVFLLYLESFVLLSLRMLYALLKLRLVLLPSLMCGLRRDHHPSQHLTFWAFSCGAVGD